MGNTFGKLGAALGSIFGPVGTAVGAAGGSVIDGNLAANKERKKANYNHLEKMRRDAEKAGFNPLTVLRATGGQGFNHGQSGALASSTFWQTFGNSAAAVLDENDPYQQKRKQLDIQQAHASLANTIASTQLMKQQTTGMLSQSAPGVIPKSFAVPPGVDVAPGALAEPDVQVSMDSEGAFVQHAVKGLKAVYTDPDTGENFTQYAGEDFGEVGVNISRHGVMKMQALEVPPLSFAVKRTGRNRGNGQVTTSYRINKQDRFLGVLPPLSKSFFIAQGKAMQIR